MPRHRAPSICPQPGCPQDQPCPTHTPPPWADSDRRRPHALRGRALQQRNAALITQAQGTCQACSGTRCGNQHLEIDHIDGDHANNNPANLQVIGAEPCHAERTKTQAAQGRHQHP